MFFDILIPLLIGLALNIVSYIIAPKPKAPKPEAAQDLQAPTADAGRPVPVAFGTIRVSGTNCLWYGEKGKRSL
jgi:hypothetical protein